MKQFKIMIAILIMATAGISLAEGDTFDNSTFSGANTFSGDITEGANSGTYETGAFNFTEESVQEVYSDIGGNAVVHGDSSANVAGNQNNCYEAGSCTSGDNGGVQQLLTVNGGNITDGGTLGGHSVWIDVPVYTYTEQFAQVTVTQDMYDADNSLVLDSVIKGKSLGFVKTQDRNSDGSPKTNNIEQWVAYNATEAALIQSNNNVAAQKIAANANTTQTVISAPSMSAPSINASNSDMCRHGVSGSGSMVGLGFSAGVTLIDKNCELLKQVRLLSNLGLSDVALALLGQDERVALAMFQADPERYSQFLNAETVRDLEAESANAEAKVNGEEVKYQNADADQEIIDGDLNGSDDNKQAKSLGANGYPLGDLLNLPIFNWLN